MRTLLAYLTLAAAAAVPWLEVLLVVPAGIVAGLSPVAVVVVAAVGNLASLVPVVLAGDRLRAGWRRRRTSGDLTATGPSEADRGGGGSPSAEAPSDDSPTDGASQSADGERVGHGRGARARRLTERYGLPGVALLGPLVTGIHVAALAALAGGAERRATLVWAAAGVVAWSVLTGVATVVGIEALVDPDALPDLGL